MARGVLRFVDAMNAKYTPDTADFDSCFSKLFTRKPWLVISTIGRSDLLLKTLASSRRSKQRVGYWEPADVAKRSASEAGPNTPPAATTNRGAPKLQGIKWNLTPINQQNA
jgi:hypothetical protein